MTPIGKCPIRTELPNRLFESQKETAQLLQNAKRPQNRKQIHWQAREADTVSVYITVCTAVHKTPQYISASLTSERLDGMSAEITELISHDNQIQYLNTFNLHQINGKCCTLNATKTNQNVKHMLLWTDMAAACRRQLKRCGAMIHAPIRPNMNSIHLQS